MRDHVNAVLGRERADADKIGNALVAHFRLHDRDAAAFDAGAHVPMGAPFLADGNRDLCSIRNLFQPCDVFRPDRRFGEPRVERRHLGYEFQRPLRRLVPVHVSGDFCLRAEDMPEIGDFRRRAIVSHRRCEFESIKTAILPIFRQFPARLQCLFRQARNIGRKDVNTAAKKVADGFSGFLPGNVPERNIERGKRIDVKAAGITAHPHHVVKVVVNSRRIGRITADHETGEKIVDEGGNGTGGDNTIGLTPADGARLSRHAHQHAAVKGGVDRSIALAHDVAVGIDHLALPQRAEIGNLARLGQREDLDGCDGAVHAASAATRPSSTRLASISAMAAASSSGVGARTPMPSITPRRASTYLVSRMR
ncbi:hypothetical protein AT6N2_C3032 [Agrobacterium tumefaciens]|nr:hypothetical protein AT6N2_C3032 [Agrobacterium tumefaciens]